MWRDRAAGMGIVKVRQELTVVLHSLVMADRVD